MPIEHIIAATPRRSPPLLISTGTCEGPGVPTISVDDVSLLRDGVRWLGVMGEIHYTRVDPAEWDRAIGMMKAGGLDVLASYVFWIHHEEVEGEFDFTGRRDLRRFVEVCAAHKLPIVMRIGPWCHGEVRNGGLPDWILNRGFETRSLDPQFLAYTRRLYGKIAGQLHGLLWKDGGPVIGIQLDNEFGGPAEYLIELKRIARDVGLDVPIYTRTGWPSTSTPMPFGEMLPLFGAYAEGFWDRELTSMPGNYWKAFCFEQLRTDVQIGFDQLGEREAKDDADTPQYPYLTCELGGGMEMSYHRRLLIDPLDIMAVAITKIGSGSNLPGYYMYNGGVNPRGKRTTLHESQATKYWNDVPVKSYDFQAPLGSFGQVRPHYHSLRRIHLFLNDFGSTLAPMAACFPDRLPKHKEDLEPLRYAIRTDGERGYLFVNNHQRGASLPVRRVTQFSIDLEMGESVRIPERLIDIPERAAFIWPFQLDLGIATLRYATAQLICKTTTGSTTTYFFGQTSGIDSDFVFDHPNAVLDRHGQTSSGSTRLVGQPGTEQALCTLTHADGRCVQIILLSDIDSLQLWKLNIQGRELVILSDATIHVDAQDQICVTREHSQQSTATLKVFGEPPRLPHANVEVPAIRAPVFSTLIIHYESSNVPQTAMRQIRPFGVLRTIGMGFANVAEAPDDTAFADAAKFAIEIPRDLDRSKQWLLRIHYVGDVARIVDRGTLILDNFYNGTPFDVSMDLLPSDTREIELQILPLQKDAPIFMDEAAKPDFGSEAAIARIDRVEWIAREAITLRVEF